VLAGVHRDRARGAAVPDLRGATCSCPVDLEIESSRVGRGVQGLDGRDRALTVGGALARRCPIAGQPPGQILAVRVCLEGILDPTRAENGRLLAVCSQRVEDVVGRIGYRIRIRVDVAEMREEATGRARFDALDDRRQRRGLSGPQPSCQIACPSGDQL
jgi:hypothetical protein